jgi:hypothetical protein
MMGKKRAMKTAKLGEKGLFGGSSIYILYHNPHEYKSLLLNGW